MGFLFLQHDGFTPLPTKSSALVAKVTRNPPHHKIHDTMVGALAVQANSMKEYIDFLLKDCPEPQKGKSSSKTGHDDFNSLPSYEVAIDTYLNHPYKVRTFTEKDDEIKAPDGKGAEIFWDVTGDFLNMGRYIDNEPEPWGNMSMGNPYGLFASVVLNLSAVWNFHEECLRLRAQRVVRLVDWLETHQIRCEIIGFDSSDSNHCEITIKRFEDPLNLNTLAVLGHTDFFRRLVFRQMEYSDTWDWGYGTATLVQRGTLQLPKIDHNGLLIFSENHSKKETINQNFDKLEKDLENAMHIGDRQFIRLI